MLRIAIVFCVVFLMIYASNACDVLREAHHGCKIDDSQCTCGFGCKSEYRYLTKKECTDALKGRASDICSRAPCLNGGTCTQVSFHPGFKCKCEGTRHYGVRCQNRCPREPTANTPHDCIEI